MRALRITLIIAVILGVVFTVADRLAVGFAESEAADRIKTGQGLKSAPEVSIEGFPFLTQVLDKRLDEVGIKLSDITASAGGRAVEVTEVTAELRDVTIGADYSSAVAASAEGAARISYADLTKAAPQGATIGWAGAERAAENQVKVEGRLVDVLEGADITVPDALKALIGDQTVSTYSTVELSGGGTVRLKADSLPELPVAGFDDKLRGAVDYDLKIDGMPQGIALDRLETTERGLKVMGTGKNVSLVG